MLYQIWDPPCWKLIGGSRWICLASVSPDVLEICSSRGGVPRFSHQEDARGRHKQNCGRWRNSRWPSSTGRSSPRVPDYGRHKKRRPSWMRSGTGIDPRGIIAPHHGQQSPLVNVPRSRRRRNPANGGMDDNIIMQAPHARPSTTRNIASCRTASPMSGPSSSRNIIWTQIGPCPNGTIP